jgi:hypothetical protein
VAEAEAEAMPESPEQPQRAPDSIHQSLRFGSHCRPDRAMRAMPARQAGVTRPTPSRFTPKTRQSPGPGAHLRARQAFPSPPKHCQTLQSTSKHSQALPTPATPRQARVASTTQSVPDSTRHSHLPVTPPTAPSERRAKPGHARTTPARAYPEPTNPTPPTHTDDDREPSKDKPSQAKT